MGFSDLGGTLVKNNEVLCKKDDDFGLEMMWGQSKNSIFVFDTNNNMLLLSCLQN